MVEEGKKSYSNIFIANTIYPEAKSIFSFHLTPIEHVKDNCYIVLDTNVLLAPYIIGKDDLLEQCRKTYSSLVAAKRLVIPGQVVREFARNRQEKLAELHQQLIRKKQIQLAKQDKYPLLSPLSEFKKVLRLGEEVNKKISEYQKAIDEVLAIVQGWHWNDPVSMLYHEVFSDETIVDIEIKEDDVRDDLSARQQHDIPPGYKDAGKKDEGVGDLLIWYTILEVGRIHCKSVIFVTGEEKADWYKKSEGQPLYPRYELVDEFRRESGGCSFHMVKFSRFLELYGATEKVVEEIKKEEGILITRPAFSTKELWVKRLSRPVDYIYRNLRRVLIEEDAKATIQFRKKLHGPYQDILEAETVIPPDTEDDIKVTLRLVSQLTHDFMLQEVDMDDIKSIEVLRKMAYDLLKSYEILLSVLRTTSFRPEV